MSSSDTIKRLFEECVFAVPAIGTWQQHSYKNYIFDVFLAAPRDGNGVPELIGDEIQRVARERFADSSREFEIICEIAHAWDEWRYAISRWQT